MIHTLISVMISSLIQEIPSFQESLDSLHPDTNAMLLQEGQAIVAVAPEWQGRVLFSSSDGPQGIAYGWLNRTLAASTEAAGQLHKLGGESRLWFGPEIGTYSVFFDPGAEQIPENICISDDLTYRKFEIFHSDATSITCGAPMQIRNSYGTLFDLEVTRKLSLIPAQSIETNLQLSIPEGVSWVAFEAETWMKNTGTETWNRKTGLLSIWEISCQIPSPNTVMIIPLSKYLEQPTTYFTKLSSDRFKTLNRHLIYKADATYMNKIGIPPGSSSPLFGSYTPEMGLLTVYQYQFENAPLYANSLWGHENPWQGDVINVFNGEVNPPEQRDWPFFEAETSSCVEELTPGSSLRHFQRVYHFHGSAESLDAIAQSILRISLQICKFQSK